MGERKRNENFYLLSDTLLSPADALEFPQSWWRHQMETFSALLALCAQNSPVTSECPSQRPVTQNFDFFFYLHLNKWLSKQSWGWWFETPSCSLWYHCNAYTKPSIYKASIHLSYSLARQPTLQHSVQSWQICPDEGSMALIQLSLQWQPLRWINRWAYEHVPLPIGPGKIKLPIRQVDSDKVVFKIIYIICIEQGKSEGFDSCDRPSNLKLDSNRQFFCPCDREIWWMTSKNNRAHLLYYIKLWASFQIHWWIQTEFTQKYNSVEIGDMLSRVTLKFDGWPWKTIGHHLFYATSSFVQHFVPIGEFKLELQSGNSQSGSNSTTFRAVQPWNLTDDLAKQ